MQPIGRRSRDGHVFGLLWDFKIGHVHIRDVCIIFLAAVLPEWFRPVAVGEGRDVKPVREAWPGDRRRPTWEETCWGTVEASLCLCPCVSGMPRPLSEHPHLIFISGAVYQPLFFWGLGEGLSAEIVPTLHLSIISPFIHVQYYSWCGPAAFSFQDFWVN